MFLPISTVITATTTAVASFLPFSSTSLPPPSDTTTTTTPATDAILTNPLRPTPAEHECYTYTTTAAAAAAAAAGSTACPGLESCVRPMCVELVTTTMPCADERCPETPTETATEECPTACPGGCATMVTNVVDTMCSG